MYFEKHVFFYYKKINTLLILPNNFFESLKMQESNTFWAHFDQHLTSMFTFIFSHQSAPTTAKICVTYSYTKNKVVDFFLFSSKPSSCCSALFVIARMCKRKLCGRLGIRIQRGVWCAFEFSATKWKHCPRVGSRINNAFYL